MISTPFSPQNKPWHWIWQLQKWGTKSTKTTPWPMLSTSVEEFWGRDGVLSTWRSLRSGLLTGHPGSLCKIPPVGSYAGQLRCRSWGWRGNRWCWHPPSRISVCGDWQGSAWIIRMWTNRYKGTQWRIEHCEISSLRRWLGYKINKNKQIKTIKPFCDFRKWW